MAVRPPTDDETTPVEVPRPRPSKPPNGMYSQVGGPAEYVADAGVVAAPFPDENTDVHNVKELVKRGKRATLSPPSSGGDPIEAIGDMKFSDVVGVLQQMGHTGEGGAGGGDNFDLKKVAKKNWLVNILIGLVIAGSSTFTAWKVMESRSIENAERSEANEAKIEKVDAKVGDVEDKVDKTNAKLDQSYKVQVRLVQSVEKLTEEQKKAKELRLEEENKRLREALRKERAR